MLYQPRVFTIRAPYENGAQFEERSSKISEESSGIACAKLVRFLLSKKLWQSNSGNRRGRSNDGCVQYLCVSSILQTKITPESN